VKDRRVWARLIGVGLGVSVGWNMVVAQSAWAATALPQLAQPITNFQVIFLAIAFLLGYAGFGTIVYGVARNRYGISWDEGISVTAAGAFAGGATVILGWIGLTAAAELPAVVEVLEMWL
jgi:hypothetical protein